MIRNLLSKFIRRVRWGRLILVAFIIAFGVLAWGTAKSAGSPGLCKLCHSMKPYYNAWEKSPHSKVQCYNCHSNYKDASGSNKPKSRRILITTNKVIIVFGKSVDYLSEKAVDGIDTLLNKKEIFRMYIDLASGDSVNPWNNCLNCHQNLVYAGENDHFGHARHLQSGSSDCRQCHDGLGHGEKAQTSWQKCAECHQNDRVRPASHNSPSFESTHGRDYSSGKNCSLCHPGGIKQKLCMDCHKLEVPHPANFKDRHIPTIAKVGIRNCMNCHEDKATEQPRRSTACESCHGWEMPHASNILQTHTVLVKAQGINSCSNCHQTNPGQKDMAISCVNCHMTEMPHRPGFKRSHGSLVYAQGEATCRYCHWPLNPVNPGAPWARPDFCISCHMQNKPHEPGFKYNHQLIYSDVNRCNTCHPNTIHCSECHVGE